MRQPDPSPIRPGPRHWALAALAFGLSYALAYLLLRGSVQAGFAHHFSSLLLGILGAALWLALRGQTEPQPITATEAHAESSSGSTASDAPTQTLLLHQDVLAQRRRRHHLQQGLERIQGAVLLQDAEGRVITMNRQAQALLDGEDSPQAQALRRWLGTLSPQLGEVLAPGVQAWDSSGRLHMAGREVLVQAAALLGLGGRQIGALLLLHDVTAEAQQHSQRDQLIQEMTQNMHIAATQQIPQAALRPAPTQALPALRTLAQVVAADRGALQRLITETRELALLRQEGLRHPQEFDLYTTLKALAAVWRPAVRGAGLQFQLVLPEGSCDLRGEEKRLLWALENILENAILYSLPGGSITLSAQPSEQRVTIRLADEGVGIAPEEQGAVLARFQRGKPRRPDGQALEVAGTGQGLYLAQKIIRAHGGSLALASTPGQGTVVTVSLPLASAPQEMSAAASSAWDQPTVQLQVPMAD